MSKILKNTTGSDIELKVLGLTIPTLSQITVAVEDYLLLASTDSITELTTLINAGDIVVNDGSSDLSASVGIAYISYPNTASNILYDNSISGFTAPTIKTALDSISQGVGIPSVANMVYVAKNGNDSTGNGNFSQPFLTIEAAITHVNANYTPSATAPVEIFVAPGVYSENNPLNLPAYVTIRGTTRLRTIVEASDPDEHLIAPSIYAGVYDLTLTGVTNSSKYLLHVAEYGQSGGNFDNIRMTSFSNGIYFGSTIGPLNCSVNNVLAVNFSGVGITISDNCSIYLNGYRVRGVQSTAVGFKQINNGTFILSSCYINDCGTGFEVAGSSGKVQLQNIAIADDCTYSLSQTGTAIIEILGGNFDSSTAIVSDLTLIKGYYFNELADEKQLRIINELSVGLPGNGAESALGEGDSYYNGSLVYEYNGSTYTNVSANSRNPTSGTFSIPGTSANNAIYVSTAFPDSSGNYQIFPGIKINVATAAVLGSGEIVAEYWDGSTWAEFAHMSQGELSTNYEKYAQAIFERAASEQIYFNQGIETDWTANDPVSLGINLYWVRFRVVSTITTAPVFNSLKIHTNRLEVNADGFIQLFGKARVIKTLSSDVKFDAAINSPANQDVYLSDNLAAGKTENEYYSAGLLSNSDQSAAVFKLPTDTCTSCPVRVIVTFCSDDTGTADFICYWNTSQDGDTIYQSSGAAPSTSTNEQSITLSQSYPSANKQDKFEFELAIPDAIPRDADGNADLLWIGLKIATSSTVNPIVVLNVTVEYVSNENGGHI